MFKNHLVCSLCSKWSKKTLIRSCIKQHLDLVHDFDMKWIWRVILHTNKPRFTFKSIKEHFSWKVWRRIWKIKKNGCICRQKKSVCRQMHTDWGIEVSARTRLIESVDRYEQSGFFWFQFECTLSSRKWELKIEE